MSKSDEQIEKQDAARAKRTNTKALPTSARKGGMVADWANADATLLLQLVCDVAVEGGAVRYGYTRDGGAYSIGLYLGDNSKTYYCNEVEGINEKLTELIEYFRG